MPPYFKLTSLCIDKSSSCEEYLIGGPYSSAIPRTATSVLRAGPCEFMSRHMYQPFTSIPSQLLVAVTLNYDVLCTRDHASCLVLETTNLVVRIQKKLGLLFRGNVDNFYDCQRTITVTPL